MPMQNVQAYWQALTHEVKKKFPNISPEEIRFHSKEPKIREMEKAVAADQLLDAINDIFEIYFGKNREKVSTTLKKAVISSILERFGMLTVQDVQFSFKRTEIEQNQFQTITVQSFCKYIQYWTNIKQSIWLAKKELVRRDEESRERDVKLEEFRKKCLDKYRECLPSGEWNGDLFESSFLSQFILKHLPKSENDMLLLSAKRQRKELEAKHEAKTKQLSRNTIRVGDEATDILEIALATEQRLFANLVVEWGIFNGIEV